MPAVNRIPFKPQPVFFELTGLTLDDMRMIRSALDNVLFRDVYKRPAEELSELISAALRG